MKQITIDFKNDMMYLNFLGTTGSIYQKCDKQNILTLFCNTEAMNILVAYNNVTFDFDGCNISGNEEITYHPETGELYPYGNIKHIATIKVPEMQKLYNAFLDAASLEETPTSEIGDFVNELINGMFNE